MQCRIKIYITKKVMKRREVQRKEVEKGRRDKIGKVTERGGIRKTSVMLTKRDHIKRK